MKFIELKDLNAGDSLILAWKDDDNMWHPYNVIIRKYDPEIEFVDPDETDLSIPSREFHHVVKGYDINGNKIIELGVWNDVKSCQEWCNFENKIMNL